MKHAFPFNLLRTQTSLTVTFSTINNIVNFNKDNISKFSVKPRFTEALTTETRKQLSLT